ncbi:response regulator [Pseudorhodoferax sp.]|uniref:response regulator n=1 Tax=Pseudorhodoferax sp. TaxID=1993553 RepID=UPI002DD698D0|nr:response regulator [Pseudorhodoferax sp.]
MNHHAGPAPGTPDPAAPPHPAGAGAARAVVGAIGSALGPPLEQAHGIVQDFIRSGKISRLALQQLDAALDDARLVAAHTSQLAELEGEPPPDATEAQRLDILVSQALARQMPNLRRHRVQLQQHTATAAWVVANPVLLPRLIDAAIAWCTRLDHRLTVSLEASGDLGTTLLRLRVQADAAATEPAAPQPLTWHVLQGLARACRVRLLQQEAGTDAILTLALEQQQAAVADPAPGDLLTSQDSLLTSQAVPLQHQRVLLVTRHDEVRAEVEHVCASLGAAVDWVATGAAAMRQFAQNRADLVLLDGRDADAATARLQQQLLAEAPDFPWITLAHEASSASLTQWMQEDGLTLTNLRSQLASTLLYGLSRTRPR